jgi:retinol dehydrogenase-13
MVTGASQGIGKAIAESIAHRRRAQFDDSAQRNYRLVLVGRNTERGKQVANAIQHETNLEVAFEACDVSDFSSVMDLQRRIVLGVGNSEKVQVGILVNDAAECPQRQQFVERPRKTNDNTVSMEQVDKQFAINILGYHFMLTAFSDHFSADTHVVNVASNWAGDLDLEDLYFQKRHYDNDSAYRQSKQCDRMLSVGWANRLANVKVNA